MSLGQQLEEHRKKNPASAAAKLKETHFDSAIEKCEAAIRDIHRPMAFSETAEQAKITAKIDGYSRTIGPDLNLNTYEYIASTHQSEMPQYFEGWVSSCNMNTFKGRIFLSQAGRSVPFTLAEDLKNRRKVALITTSLTANARERLTDEGKRYFVAFRNETTTGRLKSLHLTKLTSQPF